MAKSPVLKIALLTALLSSPLAAVADGTIEVDALALSGNWESAIGATVAITGCTITSATANSMQCLASDSGTTSFALDPSGMSQSDLTRALGDCSDFVGYPVCGVELLGTVAVKHNELLVEVNSVDWLWRASD